jgi:hypothetical protein
VTIYANSSLANTGNPGYIFTHGLIYSRANLSNNPHILTVDNDQGAGFISLDYIEVITITGGSPFNRSTTPPPTVSSTAKRNDNAGKIVGPVVGRGILLLIFLTLFATILRRRRRPLMETTTIP